MGCNFRELIGRHTNKHTIGIIIFDCDISEIHSLLFPLQKQTIYIVFFETVAHKRYLAVVYDAYQFVWIGLEYPGTLTRGFAYFHDLAQISITDLICKSKYTKSYPRSYK